MKLRLGSRSGVELKGRHTSSGYERIVDIWRFGRWQFKVTLWRSR